jgi:hypothetical protein
MEKQRIKRMTQEREALALEIVAKEKTNNDLQKAYCFLQSTRFLKDLYNVDSDFYWKSEENISYLIRAEMEGNWTDYESAN